MSLLEKIDVCFLDDRDSARQNVSRWKVRSIRKVNRHYEIQINGEWCEIHEFKDWQGRTFSSNWESRGYDTTHFGTIHKNWRQTGDACPYSSYVGEKDPLEIQACAVLEVHWPVEPDEVKRAYRQLVKKAHPDLGGDVERFRQIQEAYEVLTAQIEMAV